MPGPKGRCEIGVALQKVLVVCLHFRAGSYCTLSYLRIFFLFWKNSFSVLQIAFSLPVNGQYCPQFIQFTGICSFLYNLHHPNIFCITSNIWLVTYIGWEPVDKNLPFGLSNSRRLSTHIPVSPDPVSCWQLESILKSYLHLLPLLDLVLDEHVKISPEECLIISPADRTWK